MKARGEIRISGSARCLLTLLAMLLAGMMWSHAQNVLPADIRINGKVMWEAFEPQRQVLQKSSAVIYTDGKSHVKSVYGVVVSPEGHVLTKASEIEGQKKITMRIGRELYTEVELVGTDPQWDVAMLKVAPEQPLIPVDLSEEDDVVQGHWVISNGSASRSTRRVRVGVVSATTREIKSSASDVILGVMLSTDDALKVEKVTPKSGAEKAGLKVGDILKRSGEFELKERADLLKSMKGKKPGDTIEIEVQRAKETLEIEVELMARPGKQMMSRNDQMSGGENSLSKRRDGFPRVIHHDTPLIKSSVGGPLLDLNGRCVGMNIARASRVATFAIPARELRNIIKELTP